MKIIDKRVYTGRNIYSHKVCIRLMVDVEEYADIPTKDIDGFNERLVKALPGFKYHKCALGYEGGFLERLKEGTYLPHVFEHMVIEMQNLLGFKNVKYGKARCIEKSIYYIVFQYELEEAAMQCAYCALDCVNSFIKGKDYDMAGALRDIEKKIADIRLGPSTKGIYDEAVRRGIPVTRIGKDSILQLGYGRNQRIIEATLTDRTSCIAVDIACDKELTKKLLQEASLPTVEGLCCRTLEEALEAGNTIGYPLVVKPFNGNHGRGVTVDIKSAKELEEAFNEAAAISSKVIVEKFIEGKDYRVLVVNRKVVAVAQRIPPMVTGDGVHTIRQLVEEENKNPLRGFGHEKPMTKIPIDSIMEKYLSKNGYSLDSIPSTGERIPLRFNANLSTGGASRDCTDKIHPDNIDIAIKAADIIGLDIAGIDICTKDISKSLWNIGGAILEVNAAPGIRMHMYPSYGKSRNAAECIIDYMFPKEKPCSIPIISVTGTNGKTTTTRMIAHILSLKGMNVGMTTTSGIYINNTCISKGDNSGPESARRVLMDKNVDAAVLETARGGILRKGLGYDLADVGVITNISEDHLGIEGIDTIEDLVYVKSLVIEAVKSYGYAVLNADDPTVTLLSQRLVSNVIYFSKNADNIVLKKHLMDGGIGVFIRDGFIYLGQEDRVEPIVKISEIPSTCDGIIGYNIENAMAAASACIGIKVDIESIAKGLKTFYGDAQQNPGRFNIYSVNNFKVIVDYGHNPAGYEAVIGALKNMNAANYIGIIGVPGDRRNKDITYVGNLCGRSFDYIYIKEDKDRRGRDPGEVAKLLEEGVLSSRSGVGYKIVLDEADALRQAMNNAEDGDVITIFYEDYDKVLEVINSFKEASKHSAKAI